VDHYLLIVLTGDVQVTSILFCGFGESVEVRTTKKPVRFRWLYGSPFIHRFDSVKGGIAS
jgi:hypothetical protein